MRLLVDTHAFLWFNAGHASMGHAARRAIGSATNAPFLSVASIWEMAIKLSLRKLHLDVDLSDLVREGAIESGFTLLPVTAPHAVAVRAMPFHHRDPFDRLLVAQAQIEGLTIVSRNKAFDAYGVRRIW